MPRRARKKNIKKRVKHNAKKIQGLTAKDLLLNPSLIHSPAFKALPMEKQFQLTTQLKHAITDRCRL